MIYNVSTFYNTSERVASLLVKVTNQIIISCKTYITKGGRVTIWNQDRKTVEEKLTQCIKLDSAYRDAYNKVKNATADQDIRAFNFSEKYVFGRFESFCTRLRNLISMFSKMSLYSGLFHNRMEGLLSAEALEEDLKSFESSVRHLTLKDYDYLDFRNLEFDKDFTDFQRSVDALTDRMKVKLESTFKSCLLYTSPSPRDS